MMTITFALACLAFLSLGLVCQYGLSVSCAGVSIQKSINRTGDHANGYEIAIPIAYSVSSGWVKTSNTVAAGNLTAGHGQTTGTYDVFWTSGGGGRRYGVAVTVTTNALALTGGSGDNYPATADTTVVVCKQVIVNTAIDGDAVSILALSLEYVDPNSTSVGHIDLQDVGAATIAQLNLQSNSPVTYDITGGATNVFTGNPITVAKVSHSNVTYAATLKLISLEDSTP